MNRSKRSMTTKARKKMTKAIRNAQSGTPSLGSRTQIDELTEKELLKKYPKRVVKKEAEKLTAIKKSIKAKKVAGKRGLSKRTNTGAVEADSSPANAHREGGRWIKTLTRQTTAARKIKAHRGKK
jgi:hypothetical protein